MKTKIQVVLLIVGIFWLAGCDKTNESPEGVSLKMKAVTSSSTINGRANASGLVFSQILLGVRELEFETLEEDDQEDIDDVIDGENGDGEDDTEEIEFEGSFIVDLINGTSTPDFGTAGIQPGLYEEIEIEMGPVLADGNTVFIAFKYKPTGGDSVRVEFSTQEEIEFEIENAAGYQLDANTLTNLLVLLDLDTLFSLVDLSQAAVDEDGVIRINDTSNSAIAQQILASLENSCDAGEDDNDDGDID